ncbi:hypothetical protein [Vreelandella sp. EE7]
MHHRIMPDRERWSNWVTLAWIFAVIACLGGIFLVVNFGYVEIPRAGGYGTRREPSLFIWALAIGQAISSIMLAVIFSMLNSIYQNTCDQMKATVPKEVPLMPEEKKHSGKGLRLTHVKPESPLSAVLYTGCLIIRVNDQPVDSVKEIEPLITKAPTKVEFQAPMGEQATKWVHLKPHQDLHLKGEAAEIPA